MNMSTFELMNRLRYTALTFILLATVCLSACRPKSVPPDVMDEQRMASFMQEAYLIEGYFAVETGFMYDTLRPEMIAAYDSLLSANGITREEFEHSMDWYTHHPEFFKRVHDTVLARFDRELAAQPDEPSKEDPSVKVNNIKVTPIVFE